MHQYSSPLSSCPSVYLSVCKSLSLPLYPPSTISNHISLFHSFPHDNILDQTKLKAFADDKLNVTKMIISVFDRVENIVRKGEIACRSSFSFSHNVFKRLLFQTCQKVSMCGNGLKRAQESVIISRTLSIRSISGPQI